MDKTILIVEDEPKLRRVLSDFLRHDGFRVLEAGNGEIALQLFDRHQVDLVILDILMPGLDGWATCRRLRERSGVLILMLSAKSEEEDKLLGYELGADDYHTKPFSPRVLTAKIKALFERLETPAAAFGRKIRFRGLLIDDISHYVEANGRKIRLTPKEYDLLLCLAVNKRILLSREQLLDQVCGFDYFGDPRTVDTHINRLRDKLGEAGGLSNLEEGARTPYQRLAELLARQ